jgi:Fur family transcriptional regulator, zinc uptake regulator
MPLYTGVASVTLLHAFRKGSVPRVADLNELFLNPKHDHGSCVEQAVARALKVCEARGIRLTSLREAVLRVLAASHKALGAYDIIDRLSERGRKLAPISVYRIIDVLIEAGLVHRLESKNAYFACLSQHGEATPMVVLLCEGCNRVAEAEAPTAWGAIEAITQDSGFSVSATVFEVQGQCPDCRKHPPKAA